MLEAILKSNTQQSFYTPVNMKKIYLANPSRSIQKKDQQTNQAPSQHHKSIRLTQITDQSENRTPNTSGDNLEYLVPITI